MLFQGNESGSIIRPILHFRGWGGVGVGGKRTKLPIKLEILGSLHN